jgi:hypothetical protein
LFYGGSGPTAANRLLSEHLDGWLEGCREVVHLDFHTGLGPWGTCKLLLDYVPTESQRARLTAWYGVDAFEACDSSGIAYTQRGGFGQWCLHCNRGRDYLFACAEFGSYGPIQVLSGLRSENQAHHWGQPHDRSAQRARRRLTELFCPASATWRKTVLQRSLDLVARTVEVNS